MKRGKMVAEGELSLRPPVKMISSVKVFASRRVKELSFLTV